MGHDCLSSMLLHEVSITVGIIRHQSQNVDESYTAGLPLTGDLYIGPAAREPNPEFLRKCILPYTVSPLDFLDFSYLSVS